MFDASGKVAYVQGMVKGLCELDDYAALIRVAAKLSDARVGVESFGLMGGMRISSVEKKAS